MITDMLGQINDGERSLSESVNGFVVLKNGDYMIADTHGHRIMLYSKAKRTMQKIVGVPDDETEVNEDGPGSGVRLRYPCGLAMGPCRDDQANMQIIYCAERGRNRIISITVDDSKTYPVKIVAGGISGSKNGPCNEAQFSSPTDVTVGASGEIYVADRDNNRIAKIHTGGFVTTFAGTTETGFIDGYPTDARFDSPSGLFFHPIEETLIVADSHNSAIRAISKDGHVRTVMTGILRGYQAVSGRAVGSYATAYCPTGVTVTGSGTIFVAYNYGTCAIMCMREEADPEIYCRGSYFLESEDDPLNATTVAVDTDGKIVFTGTEFAGNGRSDMKVFKIHGPPEVPMPHINFTKEPRLDIPFARYYNNEKQEPCDHLSDVIFVVEGQKVQAHRFVLDMRDGSDYWNALIDFGDQSAGQVGTKRKREIKVIELKDVSREVFLVILRFIYTDELICTDGMLMVVMEAATITGMNILFSRCLFRVYKTISTDNVLTWLIHADKFYLNEAKIFLMNWLRSFWNNVLEFISISDQLSENPQLMLELLEHRATY